MASEIKEKVSFLEETLNRFIINSDKTLYRLSKKIQNLSDEMKEFKDEMKEFKEFVKADIEESRRERKEMNKKWGGLANRLGTFAKDIAAPNLSRIAREYFDEQEEKFKAVRLRVHKENNKEEVYEFDGVLETKNKVFLLECKSTIRMEFINALPNLIQNFKDCFPNYHNKELITIFASMSIPDDVVKKLTKMNIYAMAMGDDNMDLLNFEAIKKKRKS